MSQETIYNPDRYLKHFFLIAEPFSLTPDPEFLYLSESHADALAAIELGVMEKRGLTVLSGEVGTGKTTLAHSVLAQWRQHLHTAYLRTGTFSFDDILRKTLHQFGLESDGPVEACLDRLGDFLFQQAEAGKTVVLIIDEAQNLPPETFEQLRLLLNFETEKQKLLQLVLLGQPELERRLESHQLRHVEGRIAVRTRLDPLPAEDCARYVEHRLNVAGATTDVFSPAAMSAIVKASRGIPRRLNVLCHNALLFTYGQGQQKVDRATAVQAIRHSAGLTNTPEWTSEWTRKARELWDSPVAKVAAAALALVLCSALITGLVRQSRVDAESTPILTTEEHVAPIDTEGSPKPAEGEASSMEAIRDDEVRTLTLATGESLSQVIYESYGRFDTWMLEAFAEANPHIEDLDTIEPGVALRIPDEFLDVPRRRRRAETDRGAQR